MTLNKRITLQRFMHGDVTFGKLTCEWLPEHKDIYTLELPWKNNQQSISCIPQGIYNVTPFLSRKHGKVWRLLGVPDRDGILIHAGNYVNETEGCILVGLGILEDLNMIIKSKLARDYLNTIIGNDNLSIEVKD